MSAFVVEKEHIDFIVTAAIDFEIIAAPAALALGKCLWQENVNSVLKRYPQIQGRERTGYLQEVQLYTFKRRTHISVNDVAGAIACLDYQSCEHDEWEGSLAHDFLVRLRAALPKGTDGAKGVWSVGDHNIQTLTLNNAA